MDRLIITNGDSAVEAINHSGVPGELLAWRDVLHEGPVPDGLDDDALAEIRAHYLAGADYGLQPDILRQFRDRDRMLENASQFDEIVLWFEHDLYDQLQLAQTLERLGRAGELIDRLRLICRDEFIGESSPADLKGAFRRRTPVSSVEITHAQSAWVAFRSATPESWPDLTSEVEGGLPFLPAAMRRLIEELPDGDSKLSRSERQVLEAIHEHRRTPGEIFRFCQEREEAAFMGDWSCWRIILCLRTAGVIAGDGTSAEATDFRSPAFQHESFRLTALGSRILAGAESLLDHIVVDRWAGGTHLTSDKVWFRTREGGVSGPVDIRPPQ